MAPKSIEPKRPKTVPAEAVWDGDSEWELGRRDAKGEPVGEWRYWWKTTGHLCCVSVYEGKKTTYSRFHPDGTYSTKGIMIGDDNAPNEIIYYQKSKKPTTELAISGPEYKKVFRVEETYIGPGVSRWKNFDDKGRRIEMNGKLIAQFPMEKYAKAFGKLAVPKILAELAEFQDDVGVENFADGFVLTDEDKSLIRQYAAKGKEKELLAAFLPLGSATGGGSGYFFWNDGKRKNVTDMPLVVFGDEGGCHIVADNLDDLLAIIGADVEPMIGHDEVTYYMGSRERDPSTYIAAFRDWLDKHGIKWAKKPSVLVKKAQSNHGKAFKAWLEKLSG